MGMIDLLKRTWGVWKTDWVSWLLPPLEVYLLSLIMQFSIMVAEVILIIAMVFIMVGIILAISSPILMAVIGIGGLLISLVILIGLIVVLLLFNGVISGGLQTVICKNLYGYKYNFFDIFKSGWARKWVFFKIALIDMLIIFALFIVLLIPIVIVIVIVSVFASPVVLLASTIILEFALIFMVYILLFLVYILTPFLQAPYIASVYSEEPAGASFGRGIRFAMLHKGFFLKMGLIYAAVVVLASAVPGLGMFASIFGPPYLDTTLQMYCMDNGLVPTKLRPCPQIGHPQWPQAGQPVAWRYG